MLNKALKRNKGITLIALVVTIVVLLIFVGISINALAGQNGILKRTTQAKEESSNKQEEELIKMAVLSALTDGYAQGENQITDEGLRKEIINAIGSDENLSGSGPWKYVGKKTYYISLNGSVEDTGNWNKVLENLQDTAKRDELLNEAQELGQSSTNLDIGIGTDGNVVNLDLWTYSLDESVEGIKLSKTSGCFVHSGYQNENITEDGKIKGKVPQYIFVYSKNKIYPVADMSHTFSGCTDLKIVPTIPSSVTSIGEEAFWRCLSLTSIEIPSSVTSIEGAFKYCTSLTSIEIPSSVTSIGEGAFEGCTSLTSIEIPSSVTSVGEYAFEDCTSLASIEIPSSVTSIGDRAFWGCSELISITVDTENSTFDSRENCNAIIEKSSKTLILGCKNTVIPSTVTSIRNSAFGGCTGLTSIEIPSNVTSIGDWAFWRCSGLTSIEIPSNVTSIGDGAFWGCSRLTSITVNTENSTFDSRENCNAVIEKNTNKLILGCKNTVIPSSVTSVGEYAFGGCTGLTSIKIPSNVTSIGEWAFEDTSLRSIKIPSNVTSIGDGTFWGCSGLTSIEIPSSVTNIGDEAFWNCTGLTSIEIPSSVTSIGEDAFFGCMNLKNVTVKSGSTLTMDNLKAASLSESKVTFE